MPSPRRYRIIRMDTIYIPRSERQRSQVEFEALKKSISKIGLLQPIVVEPLVADLVFNSSSEINDTESMNAYLAANLYIWRLVAGECRLAAYRELGRLEIPAITLNDLTPIDSQIAELEENIKRTNLNWKDFCRAVARVHSMFCERNPEWTQLETSEAISITEGKLSEQLRVFAYLEDPRVAEAGTLREAYNIIRRRETRQRGDALMELLEEQAEDEENADNNQMSSLLVEEGTPQDNLEVTSFHSSISAFTIPKRAPLTRDHAQMEAESTILNTSFLDWAPNYSGQKFNFLHCDFPYGIRHGTGPQARGSEPQTLYDDSMKVYNDLLFCLTDNLENLLSISAHIMFWFSDRHRRLTVQHFKTHAPSLKWSTFPLIWVKSDNAGIAADHSRSPRHVYETCMLGSRGERMLVRTMADAYVAPTEHRLHPSCKPEAMLKHFMTMLVDENTRMLDPTCGSGSSIRAAEELGAKNLLGLEINPDYHKLAIDELRNRRMLRGFGI